MDNIKVLQYGNLDWSNVYSIPEYVSWECVDVVPDEQQVYDAIFLCMQPTEEIRDYVLRTSKAYTVFATDDLCDNEMVSEIIDCRVGDYIKQENVQDFISNELKYFFPRHYGEKHICKNITIAQGFTGTVKWNGNYSVELNADYGMDFSQIVCWRYGVTVAQDQTISLWLEYGKDKTVDLELNLYFIARNSVADIPKQFSFTEEQLSEAIHLDMENGNGTLFVSLRAKGKGQLSIIGLHARKSRKAYGEFIPGGARHVTSEREELFSYFDPGDMKPPLCVYFSGYKTLEGFEGYNMMRSMGCPFLLITEPRLEGGAFYLGSEEYENLVRKVIKDTMRRLGFSGQQVVLSGLSMGTHGAMYYGCDIRPHAIILGKPLASLGDVAANEKLYRPDGFPTSLDLLQVLEHNSEKNAIEQLNNRFWERFEQTNWKRTKFIVAYMIEDDYDSTAYQKLIDHSFKGGVQVYGKGIHGRHNDNTNGIVQWFRNQYDRVLEEDFDRKV